MNIKTLELKSYDKVYITLDMKQSWTLAEIKGRILDALSYISEKELFIVSEKTVGSAEYMDFYLDLREKLFEEKGVSSPPNIYAEGISVTKTCLVSVTFYAIKIKNDTVHASYITGENGGALGTRLKTRLVTYLYLQNIRLMRLGGEAPDEFKVWQQTNNYIHKNGFDRKDLVRSLTAITDVKRAKAVEKDDGLSEYKILNDVVLMQSNTGKPNLNHNLKIGYKLTSSYGQLFEDEDCYELIIDGKSDIKRADSEADAERQIRRTLENIGLLLENAGMEYGDILEATCFFQNKESYLSYLKITGDMGIEDFCSSYAVGDNTSEDLLFEVHATAYARKNI